MDPNKVGLALLYAAIVIILSLSLTTVVGAAQFWFTEGYQRQKDIRATKLCLAGIPRYDYHTGNPLRLDQMVWQFDVMTGRLIVVGFRLWEPVFSDAGLLVSCSTYYPLQVTWRYGLNELMGLMKQHAPEWFEGAEYV